MVSRSALCLVIAAIPIALLTGCNDGSEPDPSSEAFTGPLSNDLQVSASTDCTGGRIGPGDTVRVTGFDYLPDSVVDLRWSVEREGTTGMFPNVTADRDGEFAASLKITRGIARPGDVLVINSEGTGASGLMVLATRLNVDDC